MNATDHPIFIPDGYQINTHPTEELANFIRMSISEGRHGCSAYGGGGVGKTSALKYLSDNSSKWLKDSRGQPMGVAMRMVMASGIRRSDGAFWSAINNRIGISNAKVIKASVGMDRVLNLIRSRCGQAKVRRLVLFIDNAQRITESEYEYLEDLDSQVLDDNLSLYLVLMRQSDAEGVDVGDDWSDRASHTVRRWFIDTMRYRPITGAAEVTHALSRFDSQASWPTPEMPFSRFFAASAFDAGWRLADQAPMILQELAALRKAGKLPESEAWPMATFTLTVRHLLTEIAWKHEDFREFSREQVRDALLRSGYLRLEYVRAKMRLPDYGQGAA